MKRELFISELHRMCNTYSQKKCCSSCPLYEFNCTKSLFGMKPDTFNALYDAVATWSDAHLPKTRLTELKKIFPNVKTRDGVPPLSPCIMDTTIDCKAREAYKGCCAECRKAYWNEVLKD